VPISEPNSPERWLAHWREPYLLLIEASWPQFLLLVTAAYVLIHLLFAALYLLDPTGIGGLSGGMALPLQAFFFSVETMATIGYGVIYPLSHWVHVVMTLEALAGLILVALITGLSFARFSRMPHCIRFAETVQVGSVEGTPALLIGLNSKRRNTILDVRVQAVWKHAGVAGLTEYEPLPLQLPDGLPLQDQLTLVHRLDPQRPLQGREGALLISFSGVDATLERPIHAAHLYEASQILWRELPPTPLASPAPSL
jgi:inward rectifier potassium channel